MLITKFDMGYYSQPFFSTKILEYYLSLYYEDTLPSVFMLRNYKFEEKTFFFSLVHFFRYYFLSNKKFNNIFEFKHFVSTIMLLPCLYYETDNIYKYKKYTFERIYSEFDEKELNFINFISIIRDKYNFYCPLELDTMKEISRNISDLEWIKDYHKKIHTINLPEELLTINKELIYKAFEFSEGLFSKSMNK